MENGSIGANMGCDGYIKEWEHPIFICYQCGKEVTADNHDEHLKCMNADEEIPVLIENYRER